MMNYFEKLFVRRNKAFKKVLKKECIKQGLNILDLKFELEIFNNTRPKNLIFALQIELK